MRPLIRQLNALEAEMEAIDLAFEFQQRLEAWIKLYVANPGAQPVQHLIIASILTIEDLLR